MTSRARIFANRARVFATEQQASIDPADAGSGGGVTVYANTDNLPLSGVDVGAQAFVTETNRLYLWNGSGWYNIALINQSPTIDANTYISMYNLSANGQPTTIELTGTDPEGIPITWSYTANNLGNTASISQSNNVFTITPSTLEADEGTFSVTFKASDGVNIATASSQFTLRISQIIPVYLGSSTTSFRNTGSDWIGSFSDYGYTITATPALGTIGFSDVGYQLGSGPDQWYYVEFQPTSSGPYGGLGLALSTNYLQPNHLSSSTSGHVFLSDTVGGRTVSMLFNTAIGDVYFWFNGTYVSTKTGPSGTYYLCRTDGASAYTQPGHVVSNPSLWQYDPDTLAENQNIVL